MRKHFVLLSTAIMFIGISAATAWAQSTPTLSITASKTSVAFGESSTVSWTSTGMDYCTVHVNGAASSNWSGNTGSFTASGYDNDTYMLKCTKGGQQYTSSVTITGKILKISASPNPVESGKTSTVSWNSIGTTRCTVHVNGAASSNWSGISGSFTGKFADVNSRYDLKCLTRDGRNLTETVTVVVTPVTPPTPPVTPPPATSTPPTPPPATTTPPTPPPQATSTSPLNPTNPAYWDVKVDCAAKGDGVTNDSAAIQSCFDKAASSTVKIVNIPTGTYYVSRQKAVWDDTYNNNKTTCPYDDKAVAGYALYIPSNLTISGAGPTQSVLTLNKTGSSARVEDTYIMYAGSYLTDFNGSNVGMYSAAALQDCKTRGLTTDPTDRHGYLSDWQNHASNITIKDLGFKGQTLAENSAISIYYGHRLRLSNIATKDFYRGIKIARTADVVIENSLFEDNAYYSMLISGPQVHGRTGVTIPSPSVQIHNNRIRNGNEFFARDVAKDGHLLRDEGHFVWVAAYLNGSSIDFTNNSILGGSLNLEGVSNSTISGNTIVGSPVGIRVGYVGGGAGPKVKVINNTLARISSGITVVGHNEVGNDILTVEGNHLSQFTFVESYNGGALGAGRSFAGINVEDSKNVSVLKNTIKDLYGSYHTAGIRIATSDVNYMGNYLTPKTLLDGIYLADNNITFSSLPGSVGVYAENYSQMAWQRNTITANEKLRVINGGAPVLESPTFCRGPSASCPRRVESDDLYYSAKTIDHVCAAGQSYCDLVTLKKVAVAKANLASALTAFGGVPRLYSDVLPSRLGAWVLKAVF